MHMKLIVATVLLAPTVVLGSIGDNLYAYQDCVYQCEESSCHSSTRYEHDEFRYYNHDWTFDPQPLPIHLQCLKWDCVSNCDYQCQRLVTIMRRDNQEEIHQFYGKWPFLRVLGVQEIVSAVFSLGNLWVHLIGFFQLLNYVKTTQVSYSSFNVLFMNVVTILAWVFSTIFHIRDFKVTEKLDYYFAGLTVLSLFHNIAARVGGLHKPHRVIWRLVFGGFCAVAYALHIYKLETDWLYSYNMQANIAVGLLQNVCLYFVLYDLYSRYYEKEQLEVATVSTSILESEKSTSTATDDATTEETTTEAAEKSDSPAPPHLTYINFGRILLPSFYSTSPKLYSLYPLLLSSIVFLGMSFEVFDFPPILNDLVDAHSLWHLVTIFPAYLGWYDWIIWDLDVNVREDIEKVKTD